ncbi:B12-binding domain-containing radical SAM protein [Marinitoga litoralis]|uniref:B12-binding domain-containing radical SAM protein n=1 Tax=Marinitoga litoralis TaxID=570855 RepID=UPI0019619780|nr:radical SAM protein [Marinitoga litoralis]MBM7558990.1 radical SAM superfamily enzyme YgiQ (UPF0313 family) [Marinitoga litoralis]
MNYLLIDPKIKNSDFDFPNIKLTTCEAVLKEKHNIEILEFFYEKEMNNLNLDQFKKYKYDLFYEKLLLKINNKHIVYIDCEYGLLNDCIMLSKIIKKLNNNIIIVVGGFFINYLCNGNILHEISKYIKYIDYYFVGDYISLLDNINKIDKNKKILCKDYEFKKNILKVSWEKFNLEKYNNIIVPVFFSKGCKYSKCIFCDENLIWGNKKYIERDFEYVINELKYTFEKYKINNFYFWDSSILSHPNFKLLCQKLSKSSIKFKWVGLSRVDEINEEKAKMLKEANCQTIELGLEALDNYTLNNIKKGISINKIYKTVELLKKYNIKIEGSFVIGFPGDNIKIINKRIDTASTLDLDYYRWHNYQIPSNLLKYYFFEYEEFINLDLNIPNQLIQESIYNNKVGYFDMHLADKTYSYQLYKFPQLKIGKLNIQEIIQLTYLAIEKTNISKKNKALHSPFI